MKLKISILALALIIGFCLFSCTRPSMMPAKHAEGMPQAPGNYTPPVQQQDPRDKLIGEQAELLKLYEARIKDLEERMKARGGK